MKSIKLTANAFKGKDYVISVPVVVKPAITRNIAYNLKEAMNTDPNLGLVLSNIKFQDLRASSGCAFLDSLLNPVDEEGEALPSIAEIEEVFDPAEYLKDVSKYPKQDLYNPEGLPDNLFKLAAEGGSVQDLQDSADLLEIRPDINNSDTMVPRLSIANEVSVSRYADGSKILKVPVICRLVGKTPDGVTLITKTDKEGTNIIDPYTVSIDASVAQEGAIFNIEVTVDMKDARIYTDVHDTTGVAIDNPKIAKWKASRVFKGSVSLLPLE